MNHSKLLPLPLVFALMVGCAMQPERPETLARAQEAVAEAQANPDVPRHAPVALQRAQETLSRAEAAWQGREARGDVEHLAYLALRRAQIAEALAGRDAAIAAGFAAASQDQGALERARREAERARQQAQSYQQQLEQQRAQLREAQQQLSDLQPQQTERGIVLTLGEVLFPFNSAQLQPGNERTLDRLAAYLEANPDYQILIEGHTDAVGSAQYNQRLSERRAEAVRSALAQRGIDPSRIRSTGLGEGYPVASNAAPEGRAENRRVELVIAQGEMPPTREEVRPDVARERQGQPRG
jgi:outer membrane protein OmpA-like peptidoglycan-associated protein